MTARGEGRKTTARHPTEKVTVRQLPKGGRKSGADTPESVTVRLFHEESAASRAWEDGARPGGIEKKVVR
jgi:hypothetical protein